MKLHPAEAWTLYTIISIPVWSKVVYQTNSVYDGDIGEGKLWKIERSYANLCIIHNRNHEHNKIFILFAEE